jgi:hypothetical protein
MNCTVCTRTIFWCGALFVLTPITIGFAQKMAQPTRVWSIGPLTHGELVQGIAFGPNGATSIPSKPANQSQRSFRTSSPKDSLGLHSRPTA